MTGGIALPFDQPLILPLFLLITITLTVSLLIPPISRLYCHLFILLLLGILLILNTKGPSDLLQPAQERKKVTLEGTVLSPARTTQDITRLEIKAERLFIATHVPKLDTHRLTMTLPVINAAAHVMFLVVGEGKADTLRDVLQGDPTRLPSQSVRPTEGQLTWLLDKAAAGALSL